MVHTAGRYLRGPLTRQQVQTLMASQSRPPAQQRRTCQSCHIAAIGPGYAAQIAAQPPYNPPSRIHPPLPSSFSKHQRSSPRRPEPPAASIRQPPRLSETMPTVFSRSLLTQPPTRFAHAAGYGDRQPPVAATSLSISFPPYLQRSRLALWERCFNIAPPGGIALAYRRLRRTPSSQRNAAFHPHAFAPQKSAVCLRPFDCASYPAAGSPTLGDCPRFDLTPAAYCTVPRDHRCNLTTKGLQIPYNPELDIYGSL